MESSESALATISRSSGKRSVEERVTSTSQATLLGLLIDENRRLLRVLRELERAVTTDPLTGLTNRRGIEQAIEAAASEVTRSGVPTACLLMDLDDFKQVNDRGGHHRGDEVLCETGKTLRLFCRRQDFAGRLGGDEFIVLLARTTEAMAAACARRLQRSFAVRLRPLFHSLSWDGGLSVGVSMIEPGQFVSWENQVKQADIAMYRAKSMRALRCNC